MKLNNFYQKMKETSLRSLKEEKWTKIIASVILLTLVLLDVILKEVATTNLKNSNLLVVTEQLAFAYRLNDGISFGLLASQPAWATFFQVLVSLITIAGLIFATRKEYIFCFLLISAGGVGNIVDRFDDGHIVDYITFDKSIYFNIADTYVIFGIAFAIYALFVGEDETDEIKKIGWAKKRKKDLIKK